MLLPLGGGAGGSAFVGGPSLRSKGGAVELGSGLVLQSQEADMRSQASSCGALNRIATAALLMEAAWCSDSF
jgi:hypothetical protein